MASGGQRLLVLLVWAFCACVSVHSLPAIDASLIPWESYHKTEQILDFFKKVSLKVPSRVRCGPCPGLRASIRALVRLVASGSSSWLYACCALPGLELPDVVPGMRKYQTQTLISACRW